MANVPDLFPVSIDSRNYLVDLKQYTRQSLPVVREQADTSEERGEQSISPLDLWRRSQHSWHLGAGQEFFDDPDSERARFRDSLGVNTFNKGKLQLLPDVRTLKNTGNATWGINHQNILYVGYSSNVEKADSVTVSSPVFASVDTASFGGAGSGGHPLASDGYYVYWSASDGTIKRYDGTSITNFVTSGWTNGVGDIWFLKNRFVATQNASIYNVTASGAALPAALFTQNITGWVWTGMAEGPEYIYAGGHSGAGQKSLIYKIGIRPDGTSLDAPIVAGELPEGETLTTLYGYLGYLFIGTSKGVRLAEIDGAGNLFIGPYFGIPSNQDEPSTGGSNPKTQFWSSSSDSTVRAFEGQEQFVWFGINDIDGTNSGLGRLDLRYFTQSLTPAFATDLSTTGLIVSGSPIRSIVTVENTRVFTAGEGVVPATGRVFGEHPTEKRSSGFLKTGWITYGLPESKVLKQLEVIHSTKAAITDASIDSGLSIDDQEFDETVSVASQTTATRPRMQFNFTTNPTGVATEVQLTLTRSTGTVTDGPIVTQWTLRSMPISRRGEILVLPLMIKERVTQRNNVDKVYDTQAEYDAIKLIERTGTPVTVQIGDESFEGWVDAVRWGDDLSFTSNGKDVQGILFVTVRRFY